MEQTGVSSEPTMAENMQELLEAPASRSVRRGDLVAGRVMRVDKDGMQVDVGLKTEGIVPAHEMKSLQDLSQVKVGDEVFVCVLGWDSRAGQTLLSMDKAVGERSWKHLEQCVESGELVEGEVVGTNRGGLIAQVDGVHGFVPLSQIGLRSEPEKTTTGRVGEKLQLRVLEVDRRRQRLVLSERAALEATRAQEKQHLLEELKVGQVRKGRVTGIHPFGVFVDLGGADGLVPLSELSWENVESPQAVAKVGDEVEVYVMKVDREAQKIALSLRRTQAKPWEKLQVGQLVSGRVTRLATFGAFARVEGCIEGLIHISELADRRVEHPRDVVKEGDVLTLKILKIEPERRRLGLSLRQAKDTLAVTGAPLTE